MGNQFKKNQPLFLKAISPQYCFSKENMKAFFDSLDINFYFMDDKARYQLVSQQANDMLIKLGQDIIGKTNKEIQLDKKDGEKIYKEDLAIIKTGKGRKTLVTVEARSGFYCLEMIRKPVFDGQGKVIGLSGYVQNATKEYKRAEKYRVLSYNDYLTKTKNRNFFLEWSRQLDNKEVYEKSMPLTVVMFDVNNLKKSNDEKGHKVGDEILKKAAALIKKEAGKTYGRKKKQQIVIRYGGDEFLAICPNMDEKGASLFKKELKGASASVFVSGLPLSMAAGSFTVKDNSVSLTGAVDLADKAMYADKAIMKKADRI